MKIHSTAIVSENVQMGADCEIGPYSIIEEGVILGSKVKVGPRVHIYSGTIVGSDVRFYDGAIVGSDPQDLKYNGEKTQLIIGDRVKIREYCTLNRSVHSDSPTKVQDDVLLMAYVHVAHDCIVGKGAILANGVQLGGHVCIGQGAVIGGNTAVHQFSRVGDFAFVGGTLKIDRHVPPFTKALGDPLSFAGINTIGINRNGFEASLEEISKIYKRIYHKNNSWAEIAKEWSNHIPEQKILLEFFNQSEGKILGRR